MMRAAVSESGVLIMTGCNVATLTLYGYLDNIFCEICYTRVGCFELAGRLPPKKPVLATMRRTVRAIGFWPGLMIDGGVRKPTPQSTAPGCSGCWPVAAALAGRRPRHLPRCRDAARRDAYAVDYVHSQRQYQQQRQQAAPAGAHGTGATADGRWHWHHFDVS